MAFNCLYSSSFKSPQVCDFSKTTLALLLKEDLREEEMRNLKVALDEEMDDDNETEECFPKILPMREGECLLAEAKKFHRDLELFPNVQIFFYGPFNGPIKSDLRMFNGSIYPMGYRIRTTTPENFIINNNNGILEPLNTKFFTIEFVGNDEVVYKKDHNCKIIIQTHDMPSECGDPCKMWTKLVCDEITVYSVDVVFVSDPQAELKKMVGCLNRTREALKVHLRYFTFLFLTFIAIVMCVALVGLVVLYGYHVKAVSELKYFRDNINPYASARNI